MERKLKLLSTAIQGVFVVESKGFLDRRGTFTRLFCERELATAIGERHIVQINHSLTVTRSAVRGMHFQHPPHAEMKLVRCIRGRAWDVAVDLRANSPTLLQWHAEELTPQNNRMLIIPEGCAHGYQALEANSELIYLSTAFYTPEKEGGVLATDPLLDIHWPLSIAEQSTRDQQHPPLTPDFTGFTL